MNGLSLHFILMTMVTLKEINVLIINKSEIKSVNPFCMRYIFVIFQHQHWPEIYKNSHKIYKNSHKIFAFFNFNPPKFFLS